jgi:hypothetical protein
VHHHFDPVARKPIYVSFVKQWNNFVLEHIEQSLSVTLIGDVIVGVGFSAAYRKSVSPIECFSPPPI